MDSLELNKAAAAVLVAGIAFVGSGLLGRALVDPHVPAKPHIAIPAEAGAAAAPAEKTPEPPIAALLASASAADGEGLVKSQGCVACHSFTKGGKNGVGPNLWNTVGSPHGHVDGFAYSAALKGKQGAWNYQELTEWLLKPSAYAPGTKMSYAGLGDPKKRADIIEYLRTLSDDPKPKPTVDAAAAAAPAVVAAAAPAAAAPANPATAGASANGGSQPNANPGGGSVAAAPIAERLASADATAGAASSKKLGCVACHSFNEGGKNGIGPNLYGVVGSKIGEKDGYTFSAALKGKTGNWDFTQLDEWLTKPTTWAPGTKMTFVGIANAKDRADVIEYLRTLAATPVAQPGK